MLFLKEKKIGFEGGREREKLDKSPVTITFNHLDTVSLEFIIQVVINHTSNSWQTLHLLQIHISYANFFT